MEHRYTNKHTYTCSVYRVTQVTQRELFLSISQMFLGHFKTKGSKRHLICDGSGTYCLSERWILSQQVSYIT